MNRKLLTIFIVGTLSACGQASSDAKSQQAGAVQTVAQMQVTHVDASQVFDMRKSRPDLVVLDVRTPREFAAGHIDGAINIDFKNKNFATEVAKLDGGQDYVIHCHSGVRSTKSLKIFAAQNFSHIIHMDGGIKGWNKAGLPVVKSVVK